MNSELSKYLFYYPVTLMNGERVSRFLREYKLSQYWGRDALMEYQEKRIKEILSVAMSTDYYSKRLKIDRLLLLTGRRFTEEYSKIVPVLMKSDLIKNRQAMRVKSVGRVTAKTTGGSTGEPVTIYKNSVGLARERAATWRAYDWAGVSIGSKQARFWGVPHNNGKRIKASLIDFVANRKRFSAFDLDESSLERIVSEILSYKPEYLYGYVSAIRELATYIFRNKKDVVLEWPFSCVITTSEVLTDSDRVTIKEAFGRPVFNEYGCGEVGSIAHECRHGSLHIMSENVYLEQGSEGELIVTDLHNTAMPLIRYNVGDFATLSDRTCSCGVNLPLLEDVSGRAYDIIRTPEGRKIHPESIIYIFESLQQKYNYFEHFQVNQVSVDLLKVNLVPSGVWPEHLNSKVSEEIKRAISNSMDISISLVDRIPREASGKMRVVKYSVSDV